MGAVRRLIRPLEDDAGAVSLVTADGVRLSAHHTPATGDALGASPGAAGGASSGVGSGTSRRLAVVVAHGFTLSWAAPAARVLAAELARSAGVVAVDFRGHGRSGGVSTVGDREVLDVDAAIRYARWLGYASAVTLGFSMGAAVVVRHAGLAGRGLTEQRPAAVAAVSGPSRWNFRGTPAMRRIQLGIGTRAGRAVVRHLFATSISPAGWDPWPEPPDALAGSVAPTPLLVVHGDADPFFGVDHAVWLHAAAREPKELWIVPGFGHAEVAADPQLVSRIAAWLLRSARMPR